MPELPYSNPEIIQSAESFQTEDRRHFQELGISSLKESAILNILEGTNLSLIGRGAECVVLSKNPQPSAWWEIGPLKPKGKDIQIVTAVDYRSILDPLKARELFYAHRIMSTLFPNNFPRFFTSFSVKTDKAKISGTAREKLKVKTKDLELTYPVLDEKSQFPFSKVLETVEFLNLPIGFDIFRKNFALGPDKGVYYLDKISYSYFEQHDIDRLLTWMAENNYTQKQIRLVTTAITRINTLQKERKAVRIFKKTA